MKNFRSVLLMAVAIAVCSTIALADPALSGGVPVYQGATVTQRTADSFVAFTSTDGMTTVHAFYIQWLKQNNWHLTRDVVKPNEISMEAKRAGAIFSAGLLANGAGSSVRVRVVP